MFQTEMIEKEKVEIEIKDVSFSTHFADFLAAIFPSAEQILPNRNKIESRLVMTLTLIYNMDMGRDSGVDNKTNKQDGDGTRTQKLCVVK